MAKKRSDPSADEAQRTIDLPATKKRRASAFSSCRKPPSDAKCPAASEAKGRPAAGARSIDTPAGEQAPAHRRSDPPPPSEPAAEVPATPPPSAAPAPPKEPKREEAPVSSMAFPLAEMKQRFSGDSPDGSIVGREREKRLISDFFASTVGKRRTGSMYICGKPGTGKTAMVRAACAEVKRKCKCYSLNGMSLTGGAKDLFTELLRAVCPGALKEKMDPEASLRRIFTAPKGSRDLQHLVVIDEMDALLETGPLQSTLLALFEWPRLAGSRVTVIGIANALDLTERFMPALIRKGCQPETVSFQSYTDAALKCILAHRLSSSPPAQPPPNLLRQQLAAAVETPPASPTPPAPGVAFDAPALELCGRRVSAESGDVRKALEACRLAATSAASSVPPGGGGGPTLVKISHMARVLNGMFAPKGARGVRDLPLHPSLMLCAAVLAERGGCKGLTEEDLAQRYVRVCRKQGLQPLPQGEARQLGQSLVDCGVMRRHKEPKTRQTWMRLDVPAEAAAEALEETPLFKHALQDGMRMSALAQV